MPSKIFESIFSKGSRTYFYSSIFFPKPIKDDVFVLYGFVRTADNFVDLLPQQKTKFYEFRTETEKSLESVSYESSDLIVRSFVNLARKCLFEDNWIFSFLDSMEMDLKKSRYETLTEVESYMYGSAEVIGLMMYKILGLKPDLEKNAQLLGRAMQYINFIRDIKEDLELGRTYLPYEDINEFGLENLSFEEASSKPVNFANFMCSQLSRYGRWQKSAEDSFGDIPYSLRIPIKTASDLYAWTANEIIKNPLVVYKKKVKPSIPRIMYTLLSNSLPRWKNGK